MKGKFHLYERRKTYGSLDKINLKTFPGEPYVFCVSFVRFPLHVNLIDVISTPTKVNGSYLGQ